MVITAVVGANGAGEEKFSIQTSQFSNKQITGESFALEKYVQRGKVSAMRCLSANRNLYKLLTGDKILRGGNHF